MKTKTVKPVLISTDTHIHDTYMVDKYEYHEDGKISINGVEQELILIDLEPISDIEINEMYYSKHHKCIFRCIFKNQFFNGDEHIVIALQHQIPKAYIHKFIEQINSGEVEDVEIEDNVFVNGFVKIVDFENNSIKDKFHLLAYQIAFRNKFNSTNELALFVDKWMEENL